MTYRDLPSANQAHCVIESKRLHVVLEVGRCTPVVDAVSSSKKKKKLNFIKNKNVNASRHLTPFSGLLSSCVQPPNPSIREVGRGGVDSKVGMENIVAALLSWFGVEVVFAADLGPPQTVHQHGVGMPQSSPTFFNKQPGYDYTNTTSWCCLADYKRGCELVRDSQATPTLRTVSTLWFRVCFGPGY